MIELERTFLAKSLTDDLQNYPHKEIIDIYIPQASDHPVVRIRKNGDKLEMTKKQPHEGNDASKQLEQTINLSAAEYEALAKIPGKKVSKIRFEYPVANQKAEIDVFQEDLKGLVLIDFEFENEPDRDAFIMPEICLAEVTQETFIAGGMLCGKSYQDIEQDLKRFNYQSLYFVTSY